ncbi:MAG TPA: glycosyltransferase family 4 protein [Terriglobia bacterium]|nr:glycosyltransferase family 4 protein [Terriglobia bacterium]
MRHFNVEVERCACQPGSLAPPPSLGEAAGSRDSSLEGKRVAMVTFSFFPGDPRPRRAAEALARNGMRVDMICLAETDRDVRIELLNGIEVVRIPLKRRRGSVFSYCFQYFAFLLLTAKTLAARSMRRRYDLVYVHNMPDFLVLSALVPKILGARVILDLHDPMPELMMTIFELRQDAWPVRLLKVVEKWSIALADSVVTPNRAFVNLFISRSCTSEKMNVVMNSPDERIFPRRSAGAEPVRGRSLRSPFVIMYHGSLVERNGLDLAVDALAKARKRIPDAELRIYGARTPFLDRVMESVRSQGLEPAVRYFGSKSLEQLVPAIAECDVGIIPNHRNVFTELNMPTRIFEYLAVGKLAISPRAKGICDYFDDSSMVFFELGNAEDLAQKLEYVFSHPAEVSETIRRGQLVYEQHTWHAERRRLTSLVSRLLCKGPIPAGSVPLEAKSQKAGEKPLIREYSDV